VEQVGREGRLKRHVALLFLLPAAAFAAGNTTYSDPRWGFEITQFPGWSIEPANSAPPASVRATLHSMQASKTGQSCNVAAMDAPATGKFTQSQINLAVAQGALADTALNEIKQGMDPQAKRLSARLINMNGISAQETEVRAIYTVGTDKADMTTISLGLAVPNKTYFVNCSALTGSYVAVKSEFQQIQQSLHILFK
jgi:hypothetical protein